jgi:hypothetical protein
MKNDMDYLENLQKRHRRLNRLIDNCRATKMGYSAGVSLLTWCCASG